MRRAGRWAAIVGSLALASALLLVCYGIILVDQALGRGARNATPRLLSAPFELRSGDRWSTRELAPVLALWGVRDVTPAMPVAGELARVADGLVVDGGGRAVPPGRISVRCRASGVQLADEAGRSVGVLQLPPRVIGVMDDGGSVCWPRPLAAIAPVLLTAVVDIEDRTFLAHAGVSVRGTLRAMWRNLEAGGVREGGSTITQQLARMVLLRPLRTVPRKLFEAFLATVMEVRYDKRTILESYLNRVYLGQDGSLEIHGVEAAAQRLFGTSAAALRLEEAALLAGLIAAPNRFDPFAFPEEARRRRKAVLQAMEREGHLGPGERQQAEAAPLPSSPHPLRWPPATAYAEVAARRVSSRTMDVATHLDPVVQAAVVAGCQAGLSRLEARHPRLRRPERPLEVAVAVVAADGRVLALAGGRAHRPGDFNRAVAARRPIGSLVKPFVVAAALQLGRTLDDEVDDAPIRLAVPGGEWAPRNSDGRFRGKVSVREALVHSLNVPMVRLGMEISLPRVEATLQQAGFTPPSGRPAILLGAFEASPLEVARAYTILLSGGVRREPAFLAGPPQAGSSVWPAWTSATVLEALTEVPRRGTAAALAPEVTGFLAAKTGTSDDLRDSWFVGLRRSMVTVVWVGFDDNRETGLYGASGALEVWRAIDASLPAIYRP